MKNPRVLARIGGALYLVIIAIGLFGELYVRGRIVVSGDAAATAANLKAMESLWRLGVAAEVLLLACAVCLSMILYRLLRPVSRDVALLATVFGLVSIAIEATGAVSLYAALFPLGRAEYLQAFQPGQLYALAQLSVRAHAFTFGVALIFFAGFCIAAGYLIFVSRFIPRAIGILMQVAGACYLANSFALILAPRLANIMFPAILLPAFIGEASLCLWLLVKGVDVERWNAADRGDAR